MSVTAFNSGVQVLVEVNLDTPEPRVLLTIGDDVEPFQLTEVETERVIQGLQEGLKVVRSSKALPSPSTP